MTFPPNLINLSMSIDLWNTSIQDMDEGPEEVISVFMGKLKTLQKLRFCKLDTASISEYWKLMIPLCENLLHPEALLLNSNLEQHPDEDSSNNILNLGAITKKNPEFFYKLKELEIYVPVLSLDGFKSKDSKALHKSALSKLIIYGNLSKSENLINLFTKAQKSNSSKKDSPPLELYLPRLTVKSLSDLRGILSTLAKLSNTTGAVSISIQSKIKKADLEKVFLDFISQVERPFKIQLNFEIELHQENWDSVKGKLQANRFFASFKINDDTLFEAQDNDENDFARYSEPYWCQQQTTNSDDDYFDYQIEEYYEGEEEEDEEEEEEEDTDEQD